MLFHKLIGRACIPGRYNERRLSELFQQPNCAEGELILWRAQIIQIICTLLWDCIWLHPDNWCMCSISMFKATDRSNWLITIHELCLLASCQSNSLEMVRMNKLRWWAALVHYPVFESLVSAFCQPILDRFGLTFRFTLRIQPKNIHWPVT